MGWIELFLLALGLSMDAFAVSVTNGLCRKDMKLPWIFATAATFGVFQGLMPVLGYLLGQTFYEYIARYDHLIALILLGFIGGKMIADSFSKEEEACGLKKLTWGLLLVQGIATSIDALAVGISFSAMQVKIIPSALLICLVTFACSFIGVLIGKKFGGKLNQKAELSGGLILVGIGIKIFVEHVFFAG